MHICSTWFPDLITEWVNIVSNFRQTTPLGKAEIAYEPGNVKTEVFDERLAKHIWKSFKKVLYKLEKESKMKFSDD